MGNSTQKEKEKVKLPEGSRVMPREQQKRIQQATQERRERNTYAMKVVIRGDSGTGKTTLLRRLEGRKFVAEHNATTQLATTSIIWNYNASDESAKIELWDVVDKGITKTDPEGKEIAVADATTVDVYNGAHAVLFLVDPCKKWTLEYVKEKIPEVPDKIEILVLFSFRDLEDRHVITEKQTYEFIENQPNNVRMLEVSLKNCFGFKELHKFFNIPFLRMKKRLLADRLKRTEDEIKQGMDEVNALFEFSDYSKFLQQLAETASRKKASGGIGTRLKQKITSSQELLKRTLSTSSNSKSPRTTPEEEDVETKEVTPKAAPKVDVATSAAGVSGAGKKPAKKKTTLESIDDFNVGALDDSFFGANDDFYGKESDEEPESEEFEPVVRPELVAVKEQPAKEKLISTKPSSTVPKEQPGKSEQKQKLEPVPKLDFDQEQDEEEEDSDSFLDPDEDQDEQKGNHTRKASHQLMGYATQLSDEEESDDSDDFEDAYVAPVSSRFIKPAAPTGSAVKKSQKKAASVKKEEHSEPVMLMKEEESETVPASAIVVEDMAVASPEIIEEIEETEMAVVEKIQEEEEKPEEVKEPKVEETSKASAVAAVSAADAMENFLAGASDEEEEEEESDEEQEIPSPKASDAQSMRPMAVMQTLGSSEGYDDLSDEDDEEDEPQDPPKDRPKMLVVQSYEEEESESDDFDVVIPAAATRKFPTPKAQSKKTETPAPIFKSITTPTAPKEPEKIKIPKVNTTPEANKQDAAVMSATDILSITPTTPDKTENDWKNKSQLNSMFGMTGDKSADVNSDALLQFMKDVEKQKRGGDVEPTKEKKKSDKRKPEKKKRKKKKKKDKEQKKKKKRRPKPEVKKKIESDEDDSDSFWS